MPTAADPRQQLLAVRDLLSTVQNDADALSGRDAGRTRLGRAAKDAYRHAARGDKAGADAALADAQGVKQLRALYRGDAGHPHARDVARALDKAETSLQAIDWKQPPPPPPPPPPAVSEASIATPPGDVQASDTVPVLVSATLRRTGDAAAPASVTWRYEGLLPGPVQDTAVFRPGEAQAKAEVTVTAQPGMTEDRPFRLLLVGPTLGLTVGKPDEADGVLRAPGHRPPPPPPPPPAKGTIVFTTPIGTVVRQPTVDTTLIVEVAREGVETRDPASVPAADVSLPPDVLKAVGPAKFGAGRRIGEVEVLLHPYGAGERARAAAPRAPKRTPGRAVLRPTDLFDPGTFAQQDFVVQDGSGTGGGSNAFRDRSPAEAFAVLPFLFGWSMNWDPADVAAWTALTGRRPYVASGGSHDGGRIATWDACMGGPGGQTTYRGTNFATAMAVIPRGGGGLVPTWWMSPDQGRGTYASLAGSQQYHDRAVSFGASAYAMMVAAGKDPGQLWPRWDKEVNQHEDRAPRSPGEVPDYAAAMSTFLQGFNEGYCQKQPVKPLHILGLARHDQIGPIEAWIPKDKAGNALIAGIDISAHLPDDANDTEGQPVETQAAATRAWLRGQYDKRPCYAHDHADPRYSGLAMAAKYGLAVLHTETSPRNEAKMACHVSPGFWLGMFGFWREHAAQVGAVGVFASSAIRPDASVPHWAEGVAMLGRCARGQAP